MTNSSKQSVAKPSKKEQQALNESVYSQEGKSQHPELWY